MTRFDICGTDNCNAPTVFRALGQSSKVMGRCCEAHLGGLVSDMLRRFPGTVSVTLWTPEASAEAQRQEQTRELRWLRRSA